MAEEMFSWLTDWTRPRSNQLAGLGAGFLSGNLGNAALYAAEGKKVDDAYATAQKEEAQRQEQLNQTIAFLQQTAPKYAEAVQAGVLTPGDAYKMYVADSQPQEASKPLEINGQLVDPTTYEVLGDFRTPEAPKAPTLPASYQEYLLAQQDPEYAKRLSSTSSKPPTDAQVRASSLAIQIKPDVELLLGKDGQAGVFDAMGNGWDQFYNGVDVFGAKPLTGAITSDFKEAANAVTNIAQTYLYITSGAAAPAEEVKKIANLVTPAPFDSEQVKAQKKQRLGQYVAAIEAAAQRETLDGYSGAPAAAQQTYTYNPATGELE